MKSTATFLLLSFFCACHLSAFPSAKLVLETGVYYINQTHELESALTPEATSLIEVESQPWGIGLAILFTTLGVFVMKIGTPRPTFFLYPTP